MKVPPGPGRAAALAAFGKHGWPLDEAERVIQIESGWDPAAHHPVTKAGGLIGFMPFILKALGYRDSPQDFWRLSADEQAPWIDKYLAQVPGRYQYPGDTYLAVAAPSHVGAPESRVIYRQGTKAWALNPGWRPPGGGDITAGSIRAVLLRRRGTGRAPGAQPDAGGWGWGDAVLLAMLAFLLWPAEKDS